jgi:hypothetical protein
MKKIPVDYLAHRSADSKFTVDEAISGPLQKADLTEREILDFPWPEAGDFDFSPLQTEAEKNSKRIRIGGLWAGIMGDSFRMHGFENFLLNIAMNSELMHTLIDRMTDMYLELNDKYFSTLQGKLEIWFFGNDFGSQESLLMGRDMWADFFFVDIRKLCALAHSHNILPRGTEEDVERHVREVVGTLAPTGRYIFAPSQILGPDILVQSKN